MTKIRWYSYRGASIQRYQKLGSPFRWESYVSGTFVYSDTLAGMKALITFHKEKENGKTKRTSKAGA